MGLIQYARLLLLIGQFIGYLRKSDLNRIFYELVEEAVASAFSHILLNARWNRTHFYIFCSTGDGFQS